MSVWVTSKIHYRILLSFLFGFVLFSFILMLRFVELVWTCGHSSSGNKIKHKIVRFKNSFFVIDYYYYYYLSNGVCIFHTSSKLNIHWFVWRSIEIGKEGRILLFWFLIERNTRNSKYRKWEERHCDNVFLYCLILILKNVYSFEDDSFPVYAQFASRLFCVVLVCALLPILIWMYKCSGYSKLQFQSFLFNSLLLTMSYKLFIALWKVYKFYVENSNSI